MDPKNEHPKDAPRRRNRRITSCLACRRQKQKCNRERPCSNCVKSMRECIFLPVDSEGPILRRRLAAFKAQAAALEQSLERESADLRQTGSQNSMSSSVVSNSADNDEDLLLTSLELASLGIQDAAYDDGSDGESDDDLYDLGLRLGKMRMNERVGGFFHPQMADEMSALLDGPAAPPGDNRTPRNVAFYNLTATEKDIYFGPGPSFTPPQSDLFLGASCLSTSVDWLPPREMTDVLLQQYWDAVHPIARIVHRPSMNRRCQVFWECADRGKRPPASLRAIIFAMLFAAVVSMSSSQVFQQFGASQSALQNRLQLEAETALKKARLLSTTRLETLQAFVLCLITMCRCEISRAHSALVGMAIRLAELMGLHRDPGESHYSAVESHARRLIWYQLCFLDLRTAEVQGPRVAICPEHFSVQLPVNLNDDDIAETAHEDTAVWTDMTYTRIRLACQEMQRKCLLFRVQLEQKKLGLNEVLAQIKSFHQQMNTQYGPLLGGLSLTPLQTAAKHMMTVMINRLYTAVLHQAYRNLVIQPPTRLRQIVINTSIQQLESTIALETTPELRQWAWYSQAYHQYHVAMLLLLEVYLRPNCDEADRIWHCLDYVFETTITVDTQDGRNRKARLILSALRDRVDAYCRIRRARIPVQGGGSSHVKQNQNQNQIKPAAQTSELLAAEKLASHIHEPAGEAVHSLPLGFSLFPNADVQQLARQRQQHLNDYSLTQYTYATPSPAAVTVTQPVPAPALQLEESITTTPASTQVGPIAPDMVQDIDIDASLLDINWVGF